ALERRLRQEERRGHGGDRDGLHLVPAPLRIFPGLAPVARPAATTGTPLTRTYSMPVDSWFGWANVALSVTVAGSKTTRSAHRPALTTPRSAKRIFCAGSAVIFRMASSSVSSFSSRTYFRRMRG